MCQVILSRQRMEDKYGTDSQVDKYKARIVAGFAQVKAICKLKPFWKSETCWELEPSLLRKLCTANFFTPN